MFDLGTGDFDESQGGEDHSPLTYLKNSKRIDKLDGIFITHPHRDHIDDIENFEMLAPTVFWWASHLSDQEVYAGNKPQDSSKVATYLRICKKYSGTITHADSPGNIANNGCTQFEVFRVKNTNRGNLNDQSLALVIAYAGTKILMTGDQERGAWKELLANPAFVKAAGKTDILLASHHGRESGFHSELFDVIGNPSLVIISDTNAPSTCVRDKYYHKTNDTGWNVHSRSGAESETRYCLTTRDDGTIQVTCKKDENGKTWRNVTRK